MTLNWPGVLICWRVGRLWRRIWINRPGSIVRWCPTQAEVVGAVSELLWVLNFYLGLNHNSGSTRWAHGSCSGVKQSRAVLHAEGRVAGKLPSRGTWRSSSTPACTWARHVSRRPRKPTECWLVSGTVRPAGLGQRLSLFTWRWWGHTLYPVLSFGPLTTRKTLRSWTTKLKKGLESKSCEKQLKELWLFTLKKRRLRRSYCSLQLWKEGVARWGLVSSR